MFCFKLKQAKPAKLSVFNYVAFAGVVSAFAKLC